MIRQLNLLLVALVVLLAGRVAGAAEYFCCDMTQPGSQCKWNLTTSQPYSFFDLTNACAGIPASSWMVAVASKPGNGGVGPVGGITVGQRVTSPPFSGLCLGTGPGEAFVPSACAALIPTGGFQVQPTSGTFTMNYISAMAPSIALASPGVCYRQESCYLGASQRQVPIVCDPHSSTEICDSPKTTVFAGGYSCGAAGPVNYYNFPVDSGCLTNATNTMWGSMYSDLQIPVVFGSVPLLGLPSTATLFDLAPPSWDLSSALDGTPAFLTAVHNGQTVASSVPIGTTNAAGSLHFTRQPWQAADVGAWTYTVFVGPYSAIANWSVADVPVSLASNGRTWVGVVPSFSVSHNDPSTSGFWTTTLNGAPVSRFANFTTDAAGQAILPEPTWTASDVGQWTARVTVAGRVSNLLSFTVTTLPPAAAPAAPVGWVIAFGVGLGALGIALARRQAAVVALLLFAGLAVVPNRAHAAEYMCCNMDKPGDCEWGRSTTGVSHALLYDASCPSTSTGEWSVVLAASSRTGVVKIGSKITAPPFHGLCYGTGNGDSFVPAYCVALTATLGFQIAPVWHGQNDPGTDYTTINYVSTVTPKAIMTPMGGCYRRESCYAGDVVRAVPRVCNPHGPEPHACTSPKTTVYPGKYSCGGAGPVNYYNYPSKNDVDCIEDGPNVSWGTLFSDLEIPTATASLLLPWDETSVVARTPAGFSDEFAAFLSVLGVKV